MSSLDDILDFVETSKINFENTSRSSCSEESARSSKMKQHSAGSAFSLFVSTNIKEGFLKAVLKGLLATFVVFFCHQKTDWQKELWALLDAITFFKSWTYLNPNSKKLGAVRYLHKNLHHKSFSLLNVVITKPAKQQSTKTWAHCCILNRPFIKNMSYSFSSHHWGFFWGDVSDMFWMWFQAWGFGTVFISKYDEDGKCCSPGRRFPLFLLHTTTWERQSWLFQSDTQHPDSAITRRRSQ